MLNEAFSRREPNHLICVLVIDLYICCSYLGCLKFGVKMLLPFYLYIAKYDNKRLLRTPIYLSVNNVLVLVTSSIIVKYKKRHVSPVAFSVAG